MRYYDKKNHRLVFEGSQASPEFWDKQWESGSLKKTIEKGRNERFVSQITKRFIPASKSKKILEGGCGRGNLVYSLDWCGYDAYGIDYAKETIKKINALFPELKITYGNLLTLNFPDNYFDGYWSRGVIEHFFEGYSEIEKEMYRVIKPGGFLFLTFPYFSPVRKLKSYLGFYPDYIQTTPNKQRFYQFALNHNSVIRDFHKQGFTLIYRKSYNGMTGLKEIGFLEPLADKIYKSNNLLLKIVSFFLDKVFSLVGGHSMLLVLKKNR